MTTHEINWSNIENIDPSTLTQEQREEYNIRYTEYLTQKRNTYINNYFSGQNNPQYDYLKILKNENLAKFNELHEQVITVFDPNHTKTLACKSFTKSTLNESRIEWKRTESTLNKYTLAGQNLAQTGTTGNIDLHTTITDTNMLKSYVSNQQGYFTKQEKIDYASYLQAQQDNSIAYKKYQQADTDLGNAIGQERSYVDEMRYLDERMMRANIDYLG